MTANVTRLVQRRSKRLQMKVYQAHLQECIHESSVGFFVILPDEIIFTTFNFLSVEDLSLLSITSKSMCDLVISYMLSKQGQRHLLPKKCRMKNRKGKPQKTSLPDARNHFKLLGLLMKRSSCLRPTRDRLRVMDLFLTQIFHSCQFDRVSEFQCFGSFLSMLVRGWEERECLRAYIAVSCHKHIAEKLASVLMSTPGALGSVEYEIRLFLRLSILDRCDSLEDLGMWINFILKPYPLVQQARLIYLLYGPVLSSQSLLNWYYMVSPNSHLVNICSFSELAVAFKALFAHSSWSDDSVISVLEEISGCPEDWNINNTAKLLLLCGEGICLRVLASKAINGNLAEVANIIVALSMIIRRENMAMPWLVNLVHNVCASMKTVRDAHNLLFTIPNLYKALTVQHPQSFEEGHMMQVMHIADTQAELMRELFIRSCVEKRET